MVEVALWGNLKPLVGGNDTVEVEASTVGQLLTNLEKAYPALARALLRRSQEDLLSARNLLELTGNATAEAKLAALLHDFAAAASNSSCHIASEFDLPLTRGEIASMLGLTIETVSGKFGELEDTGAIARKGKRGIDIADPALLQTLSGRQSA